jgi:hypothetical protein
MISIFLSSIDKLVNICNMLFLQRSLLMTVTIDQQCNNSMCIIAKNSSQYCTLCTIVISNDSIHTVIVSEH